VRTDFRVVISTCASGVIGTVGWVARPFPTGDDLVQVIGLHDPRLFDLCLWAYTGLLYTTPFLLASLLCSIVYIFLPRDRTSAGHGSAPPYPLPTSREDLFVILGEQHHPTQALPVEHPRWLTIPERGLYTGIAIVGAVGTGKTTGCLYPYAQQLLGYRADDPTRRVGGLALEVKGDFCHQLQALLTAHGRRDDYVEVSLTSPYRYNPLHTDLDAYALAYGLASLMNNLYGHGKEPFWQQAYTNLVKFLILLHQVLDDYVTLFDVYEGAINPDRLGDLIARGDARFATEEQHIVIRQADYAGRSTAELTAVLSPDRQPGRLIAPRTRKIEEQLEAAGIPFDVTSSPSDLSQADQRRRDQFAAVKRWFNHDWTRIDLKLRTTIVEGIAVFLSLFDDNPSVKYTFCPPKECYDPVANADGRYGTPLPPFAQLIERGQLCALNFPVSANPGLAKAIGTMMKQDFQRAVLNRIPQMAREPERPWRPILFLCDEYHAFATVGEHDPTGDEKFFALSRQAKCIAIVSTQSISSLRSTLRGEAWRTLLQTFRTKIFLALSDDFSAQIASELCGKAEQLKPTYTLTETGQDAHVSMLTGRASANKAALSTSQSYQARFEPVFEPKVFAELKNAQAIVLAYDGLNPWPPTYCYLKPGHLNPNRTYFEQLARGEL
jgi:hypothetical protein